MNNPLHRHPLAMKERAVGLQKVPLAAKAMKLTPRPTARMPIGTQVAQAQPASIVTARMGTEMLRSIDYTPACRCVGGIGSGSTGGGAWGCAASCAHRAQGGLCVRPANGWGSLERLRL